MKKPFNWPLAVSPFTLRDRFKVARRIMRYDRYTMGEKVEELEEKFSKLADARFTVACSSGSAANQILFEVWKHNNPGETAVVIVPAVTWVSSVSPAIMAGFAIKFCDINRTDFSFDYTKLDELLASLAPHRVIIWATALIGFCPDMECLRHLAAQHGAELFLDSCENTLSREMGRSILASCGMTTTSLYFSHQVVAIEFGFVFFESERDWETARMFRNHGLSRSLPMMNRRRTDAERQNPFVDPSFLFAISGTNSRPSEIHAMFGLLDFERIPETSSHRAKLYARFWDKMKVGGFHDPHARPLFHEGGLASFTHEISDTHSAWVLPIFHTGSGVERLKATLNEAGIETRPIIGGNLLRQPPFKCYGSPTDFPNAEWVHNQGFYVGLHKGVTPAMIDGLVGMLGDWMASK